MTATPFETASRAALTSNAAEATFIDALVAANPTKVSRVVLGQTVQGRDVYALVFGAGTGAPLLCLNSVHGDETMPREAAITLARDLCETAHGWDALLAERKLYLVVNANPDGREALTRTNANTEDINRHYLDLASTAPESVMFAGLIHDLMPAATYDGHEWNGKPDADCYIGMGNFSAIDPEVRAAQVATGEAVGAALTTWGATVTGWYPQPSPENSILHLGGLLGIPSFLMETAEVDYGNTALYGQRHDRHRVALGAWLDHMAAEAATCEAVGTAARARMAAKVGRDDYFWFIHHLTPMPPALWSDSGVVVDAASYTATDLAAVSAVLDAHGIPYNATTGAVALDHDRASIAAHILDPLGLNLGAATRNAPPTQAGGSPGGTTNPAHQLWPDALA